MPLVPIKTSNQQQNKNNVTDITKAAALPDSYWPSMLSAIRDSAEVAFIECGEDKEKAIKLASIAVITWANLIGGQMLYLPIGQRLKKAIRDGELESLFDGSNTIELAARFQMSRQNVYKIISEQRKLRILNRERIGINRNENS